MYEGRSKGASVMAATMSMIICGTNKPKDNNNELIFNHPIEGIVDDKGKPLLPTIPPPSVDRMTLRAGVPEFTCNEIDLERYIL